MNQRKESNNRARNPRTSAGDRSRNARRQSNKRKTQQLVTIKRNTKFSGQIRENENNESYEGGNLENENYVDGNSEEERSNATREIGGFDEYGDNNDFSGSEDDFTDKKIQLMTYGLTKKKKKVKKKLILKFVRILT